MDAAISDLALDLGVFALDNEIENGRMITPAETAHSDKNLLECVQS